MKDLNQILAWLEELARIRTVMDMRFAETELMPIAVRAEAVGEETRQCTFSLQRPPTQEPTPGQSVELVFALDGQRFITELRYDGRGGYLEYRFGLPKAIRRAERRDCTRVHFRSREKYRAVAIQGLFDGIGLSGELLNLSMEGFGFRVHRVIRIGDERRLAISADLLAPGTPLALVRLPELPRLPMFECAGRVSHMRSSPSGVSMGVAFDSLSTSNSAILGKFLAERIPGFHPEFPIKRRFKDLTETEAALPQPAAEEPAPPNDAAEALSDAELNELTEAVRGESRIGSLRKRGKKVLFIMPDELGRTLLMAIFHQDGYRCLFEANSLVQALDLHRRMAIDLLVLDHAVGRHGALEVVDTLRAQGLSMKVPVVVLQRQPDVRLKVASRAGGIALVVDHPVDFPGQMKSSLEDLLQLY